MSLAQTMTKRPPKVIELSAPQHEFVSTDAIYPAFVGGFGSGKTQANISRLAAKKLIDPECNVAYYLPTYDLVKQIGYPRFIEHFENLGIPVKLNATDHILHVNKGKWGQVIFRTLDKPANIIGYEVADSGVDELDTLPRDKADDAWTKIIGRNRQKKRGGALNTVGVATTPEGFRFCYDTWDKVGRKTTLEKGYKLIQAPTSSNRKFLPLNYESDLRNTYPDALCTAYLEGRFVNLTSGTVYTGYDRKKNHSNERIINTDTVKDTLHIGMDFNVTKMAAAIHVIRGDTVHCVGELVDVFDTPAMIKLIKERFKDRGHPVMIYPDASGKARDSNNASETDITLLRAEFTVCVNSKNPAVRDRILSTNVLMDRQGERRYFVNPEMAPHLVEGFEKQIYDKNGEPDKTAGIDHIIDAATYFIVYKFPIVKHLVQIAQMSHR